MKLNTYIFVIYGLLKIMLVEQQWNFYCDSYKMFLCTLKINCSKHLLIYTFHVNKFHNTLITTGMMCLSLRRLSPIFMPAWTIYIHKWRVNTGSVISIYKEKLKKIVLESTFIKRSWKRLYWTQDLGFIPFPEVPMNMTKSTQNLGLSGCFPQERMAICDSTRHD